jgi:hypothetical protein
MKTKISPDVVRGIAFRASFLVMILAFVVGGIMGCTTYTNGDAQVDNQTMGAGQDIQKQVSVLQDPAVVPDAASKALNQIIADAQDVVANGKQQIDVHGGPAAFTGLTAYNATASLAARTQSSTDHSTPWYLKLLYGITGFVAGAGAMTAAAMKIPLIGSLLNSVAGKAITALLSHIGDIHGKAQAGTLTATDVVSGVGDLLSDPAIKPIEDDVLNALHIGAHTTPTAAATSASIDVPPPPPGPGTTSSTATDAPVPAAPVAVAPASVIVPAAQPVPKP